MTAAYGRGSHSVNGHFRSYFGHGVPRRGIQRHPFAPSHEPWDWGGGWWAGYHYCGGWTYQLRLRSPRLLHLRRWVTQGYCGPKNQVPGLELDSGQRLPEGPVCGFELLFIELSARVSEAPSKLIQRLGGNDAGLSDWQTGAIIA